MLCSANRDLQTILDAQKAQLEEVEWQNQFLQACSSAPWSCPQSFTIEDDKEAQFKQTQKICAMISAETVALKTCC
eukprot:12405239-Karenia_brevis.AAC.1